MGSESGASQQITSTDATSEQPADQNMEQPVSLLSAQPSFSYMQAMAGFMGVVEAPKAEDPAVLAAAALEFLDVMWQICEEQEHDPEADSGGQHRTAYEETARSLAGRVHVSTVTRGPEVSSSPGGQCGEDEEMSGACEDLEQWRLSRKERVEIGAAVAQKELQAGAAYVKRHELKASIADQVLFKVNDQKQAMKSAKEGKKKVLKRLSQPSAAMDNNVDLQQAAAAVNGRKQAVHELKDSIRRVFMHLKNVNDLRRTKLEMKKQARDAQEYDLLSQGINPYETFRRETLKAAKAAENSRHERIANQRKEQILRSLLREEQAWHRKLKAAEVQKGYDEAFQANQGGSAEEARISAYMRRTTKQHVEIIDATGHNPVPASQAVRTKHILLPEDKITEDMDHVSDSPTEVKEANTPTIKQELGDELAAVPELPGSWGNCHTDVSRVKAVTSTMRQAQEAPNQAAACNQIAAPCICDPPVLVFKDIEAGTMYHKTVKVTNTSSELQAFRVQDVPAEHATILDVKQDRYGFVSAGMGVKLTVSLVPEVEDDISTEIGVLTDKGFCRVPVKILCKKALLSVTTGSVLDLGCILRGQKSTQHITLKNAGALQAKFVVQKTNVRDQAEALHDEGPTNDESELLQTGAFKILQEQGVCLGYSSTIITICFEPTDATEYEEDLEIVCSVKQNGPVRTEPEIFHVHLQGTGLDVPIKVESDLIDLTMFVIELGSVEATSEGNLCSACIQVVLHNHANNALKVKAKVPSCLTPYVTLSPTLAFVQGYGSQAIAITVIPATAMLTDCHKFLIELDTFQFPIHFSIPEQSIPPTVSVRMHVSHAGLVVSPSQLDLGVVTISEGKTFPVRITNKGCLWDSFSFLDAPRGVSVTGGGCGSVAPNDSVNVDVTFTPELTGFHELSLSVHSLLSSSSKLGITCNVVHGALKLSQNVVRMAATAFGSTTSASVVLSNTNASEQRFAFEIDEQSDLQVTPSFGTIGPNSCIRVQLDYHPSSSLIPSESESKSDTPEKAEPDKDSANDVNKTLERDITLGTSSCKQCKPCTWHLQCFSMEPGGPSSEGQQVDCVALEVHTCAVAPCLLLTGDVALDADRHRYVCDFGTVCTGAKAVKELKIHSTHSHTVEISCTSNHPLGPYEQLTACRGIEPGMSVPFKLAFRPTSSGAFWEVLELHADGLTICCELSGNATGPELQMEDSEQKEVDLGLLTPHSSKCPSRELNITNPCPFPIVCEPVLKLPTAPNIGNMKKSCYFHPAQGTVGANGTMTIQMKYVPDWQAPALDNSVGIGPQNGADVISLPMSGKRTHDCILITGASVTSSHERLPPSIPTATCPSPQSRRIVAQFTAPVKYGEAETLELQVVNTLPQALAGSLQLDVEPLAQEDEEFGWSLASTTVQVPNGESRPLQIRLQPSPAVPDPIKVYTGEERQELRLRCKCREVSYVVTVRAIVRNRCLSRQMHPISNRWYDGTHPEESVSSIATLSSATKRYHRGAGLQFVL